MYATDWAEQVGADENSRFERLAGTLREIQASRDARYSEKGRTLHRQAHAGVEGTFRVRDDLAAVLPVELQVGPFVPGATFPAFVRFSNGGMERARKDVPDVRGVAVKLLGVEGPKALGSASTQDFLLNNRPTQLLRTPEEFVHLLDAASKGGPLGTLFRLAGHVGYLRAFSIIRGMLGVLGTPFSGYANETFWSITPFRLGPTACRFRLVAIDVSPKAGATLAADLVARLAGGASWRFELQLFQDEARTPIEDSTRDWDAPWVAVATLDVAPVDPASARGSRVADYVETLAFDPWHAHELLRPLGAFNRARKATYFGGSVQGRGARPDEEVAPIPPEVNAP